MDPATVKFTQALPFALVPVSTQLAALHTARTRSHSFYSCNRCGSELTTHTRVVRSSKQTNPSRAISASCSACGGVFSVALERGNACSFPARKRELLNSPAVPPQPNPCDRLPASVPSDIQTPSSSSSPTIQPSEARPAQAIQHSPKSKKKSGLQEMLQRNREKEKKRAKTEETKPAGLSAFLGAL